MQQSGRLQAGSHAEKHAYHFIIKLGRRKTHRTQPTKRLLETAARPSEDCPFLCRHGILIQSRKIGYLFIYLFIFGLLLFSENGQCHMETTNWVNCISGQHSMCQAAKPMNTRGVLMETLIPSYYSGLSVAADNDLLRVFQGF